MVMKIKKFNENINNFNWSIEKFDELGKIQKELRTLFPNLVDYLKLMDEDFSDLTKEDITEIVVTEKDDEYITLIINNGAAGVSLTRDEFKDFLLFIKDPNLYKNAKKYNI